MNFKISKIDFLNILWSFRDMIWQDVSFHTKFWQTLKFHSRNKIEKKEKKYILSPLPIFSNILKQLYVCICVHNTVQNITIKKYKNIEQKVLFQITTHFSYHKGIWGWAKTSFDLCSSSVKNLPKNGYKVGKIHKTKNAWKGPEKNITLTTHI